HFAHAFHFLDVADRGGSAVGVQVVDRAFNGRQRLLHAADCAFAAWCDHVVTVGGRAITDQLRVDFRATGQSVFQLFDNDHAATASDDEAVTVRVISARRLFRGVIT